VNDRTTNLDYVFKPRSVAFVGATEGGAKWGFIIFNNLISGGYEGKLYPVNPGRETVMGMKCYPSVRDIPGEVDLAVFTVPAKAVIGALDDCAEKGVKAALIITAGFKELGEEGAALQAEMVAKADAAGITLVGPNGEGVACPQASFYSWMPVFYPREGPISVVAQSGNILNMLIGHGLDSGFGVAKAVSSGNEAQLKTEDYIHYFANDPETDVVASYMEGVEDGRHFFDTVSAATRLKPVVMIKGGRSSTGMRAAASHTGAMAVAGELFESACRQAGLVLARNIREAGITAASFVNRPLPRGRRVGIVTGGGGLGVVAADACTEFGLEVPALSPATLDSIQALLPDYFVPGNPVDLVAGLNLTVVKPIIETVMNSGEVDSVMFIFVEAQRNKGPNIQEFGGKGIDMAKYWEMAMKDVRPAINNLHGLAHEIGVPLYITANVDTGRLGSGLNSNDNGSPVIYKEVEASCAAISAMAQYYAYLQNS
jgi:acyl-CoA synthetase (NDP forming)